MQWKNWCESGALQTRAMQEATRVGCKRMLVGAFHRQHAAFAAIGYGTGFDAATGLLPTGCITKLFTATLISRAMAEGAFRLDTLIPDLLPASCSQGFEAVSVRQLLEHTHALDDSAVEEAPIRPDGFVDIARLQHVLTSTAALARPGQLYSYSNGGPWLLAAILESLFKTRYADLLHEKLFAVLSMSRERDDSLAWCGSDHVICPSRGGSLAVSVESLLRFLQYHLCGRSGLFFDASPERVHAEVVPLPGWSMVERGVRLAWKYYGQGWFGHDAILPNCSALVRLHPHDSVGVVMAVPGHAAIALAAKLFKGLLPDCSAIAFPRLLTASELARLDMHRHTGIYGSSTVRVVIEPGSDFILQLSAYRRKPNGGAESVPFTATALRPGVADTFIACSPGPHLFPFVQFIASAEHSTRHLWNGRSVLPRLA